LGSNEVFAFGEEELMQVVVKFVVLFKWQWVEWCLSF
jgi:hypothetical protein